MELRDLAEQVLFATTPDDKLQSPTVFVFNPFAEAYIAHGKSFTPVKHQAMLARDLANLPQFLCRSDDIVLVAKRPSVEFLSAVKQCGLPAAGVRRTKRGTHRSGRSLCQRKLGSLRPWAWGPDSVELLEPLFAQVTGEARTAQSVISTTASPASTPRPGAPPFSETVLARSRQARHASNPPERAR